MRAAQAGSVQVIAHRRTFVVASETRRQVIDISAQVEEAVQSAGGRPSVCSSSYGASSGRTTPTATMICVTVGITGERLAFERPRSILLVEWDGPRSRTVDIQILGT